MRVIIIFQARGITNCVNQINAISTTICAVQGINGRYFMFLEKLLDSFISMRPRFLPRPGKIKNRYIIPHRTIFPGMPASPYVDLLSVMSLQLGKWDSKMCV